MRKETGNTYGRLLVLTQGRSTVKGVKWWVMCRGGDTTRHAPRIVEVAGRNLRGGNTRSCGCLRSEKAAVIGKSRATHGMTRTPTYGTWFAMWQRCTNPNNARWMYYGERGVTVCERWRSFESFLDDMGTRPWGRTLDRIDTNGNYEPGNCKWSTPKEQANNRRPRRPKQ